MTPTLTPIEATEKVAMVGTFTEDGFEYEVGDLDDAASCVCKATGEVFFASGQIGDPVSSTTEWVA